MSNIHKFDNELNIDLQYKKLATILEVLHVMPYYKKYNTVKSNKIMIKKMLDELGLIEHYNDDIDMIFKDGYCFTKFKKNLLLKIKLLDDVCIDIICIENEKISFSSDMIQDKIYFFTTPNGNLLFNPHLIFGKKIITFFENTSINLQKDLIGINSKFLNFQKNININSRFRLNNIISLETSPEILSEGQKIIDKIVDTKKPVILESLKKKYNLIVLLNDSNII
tara:strand:- start:31 stop:702 length:672 start_codon:yes stop_codon:yes gene_type:complete